MAPSFCFRDGGCSRSTNIPNFKVFNPNLNTAHEVLDTSMVNMPISAVCIQFWEHVALKTHPTKLEHLNLKPGSLILITDEGIRRKIWNRVDWSVSLEEHLWTDVKRQISVPKWDFGDHSHEYRFAHKSWVWVCAKIQYPDGHVDIAHFDYTPDTTAELGRIKFVRNPNNTHEKRYRDMPRANTVFGDNYYYAAPQSHTTQNIAPTGNSSAPGPSGGAASGPSRQRTPRPVKSSSQVTRTGTLQGSRPKTPQATGMFAPLHMSPTAMSSPSPSGNSMHGMTSYKRPQFDPTSTPSSPDLSNLGPPGAGIELYLRETATTHRRDPLTTYSIRNPSFVSAIANGIDFEINYGQGSRWASMRNYLSSNYLRDDPRQSAYFVWVWWLSKDVATGNLFRHYVSYTPDFADDGRYIFVRDPDRSRSEAHRLAPLPPRRCQVLHLPIQNLLG